MLTKILRDNSHYLRQELRLVQNGSSEDTVRIDGQELKVTISVGITTSRPQDTLETMLKRADSLMYQSKRNGRNKVMTDISAEDI